MRRRVAVLLLAASPAFGHGASRGLHLHATPERAAPGTKVTITVDASRPMKELKVGFVGGEPVRVVPKTPARRLEVVLTVPSGTANAHAEAVSDEGKTLRAALLLQP